ncbi:AAA domain-containing protein [Roseivivax marinus]|uniref:AAA family ATPase n=1 Tax=Roseivivax marinus TaxID=1379903 RepID=UPI0008D4083A|nr:AAA family ATPase [Roseivivax marinus]SEK40224.1 AAA domain-containing protein [Roseivivax marinus]
MTLYKPTLVLKRLRVEKSSHPAYDEKFSDGVNIIRGANSSGKSTIMNMIYYALGGDLSKWSKEALLCDQVLAEVEINGHVGTLRREISEQQGRPMEIIGADMDSALNSPIGNWSRYPYSRSSKESFSQVLFRLMEIPEAAGEATGNLTMHQILRLTYSDQLSPAESLFRYDGRWDSPVIRDAVGRLMCGAHETKIFENQLRLRELKKQYDTLDGRYAAFLSAYGVEGEPLTMEWVQLQKENYSRDLDKLSSKIMSVEKQQLTADEDEISLSEQNELYAELQTQLNILNEAQDERDRLSITALDLRRYIESQREKLRSIQDAQVVSESFGAIHFDACPVCLEPIVDTPEHACHLCKTPVDPNQRRGQFFNMVNEISIQIKQAEQVLKRKDEELDQATAAVETARKNWNDASRRFAMVKSRPTSATQAELRELYREKGYIERQLEDQERMESIVSRISSASSEKERVSIEIEKLENENTALAKAQEDTLKSAYTSISDNIKTFLKADLPRQDSFKDPETVDFDFGSNRISVDGNVYFSASSRVILKSSFFLGFLMAAAENSYFRHPRFCLIDTIEDKGMEEVRSKNFQRTIVEIARQHPVKHQIIFATSMIDESLDTEDYTVGKFSTLDSHTLELG